MVSRTAFRAGSFVRMSRHRETFTKVENGSRIELMKKDIHPTYFPEAKVICACGNSFVVGATKPEIRVEICAKCHPFYTGEEKLLDVAGRVEKFKARREKASTVTKKEKKVRVKKAK